MRSVRRVGEAGTHPTSTDHVSGPIQTASNGETVGKNQVNCLYIPQESSKFLYAYTRMTVTPPLAMAPVTQEDDMRWNPNDDGIVFNP